MVGLQVGYIVFCIAVDQGRSQRDESIFLSFSLSIAFLNILLR